MKVKKINLEAFQGEELTQIEKQLIMAGSGISNSMSDPTVTFASDHDVMPNDNNETDT